ncbi:MAG: YlxR family protein [Eubacteriales bacterium]|nr:YlxR family protein [Eubacteriales bacterium]
MIKPRKIPMRMCMGCRTRRPKRELVRVVRTPEGAVVLDPTGKKSGRGTYVCADNPACLEKAVKSKALERALEAPVSQEIYEELRRALEQNIKEGTDDRE